VRPGKVHADNTDYALQVLTYWEWTELTELQAGHPGVVVLSSESCPEHPSYTPPGHHSYSDIQTRPQLSRKRLLLVAPTVSVVIWSGRQVPTGRHLTGGLPCGMVQAATAPEACLYTNTVHYTRNIIE
jgi:hypothetical protein